MSVVKTISSEVVTHENIPFINDRLEETKQNERPKRKIVWWSVLVVVIFHSLALVSLFRLHKMKVLTILWIWTYFWFGIFGITAGAHRLWSHRSYKAKLPLQVLLLACYSSAGLYPLFTWVRDHRLHHKFSDTNADPHDSSRGLFFSHIGWLMQRKHPEVHRKGKTINIDDVASNRMLSFYNRNFMFFKIVFCFVLPVLVPVYLWKETWLNAIASQDFIRYVMVLNVMFSVNSFAHAFGTRPYNKKIKPGNIPSVAFFTMGEGWHNYHHAFPWDYKAGELGNYTLNLTTMLLHFFQKIGQAYDMKQASEKMIRTYVESHGDNNIREIPEFEEKSE